MTPHYKGVQAVFTDLDGTLLAKEPVINDTTKIALEKAHRAGLHVIPCSGRGPFFMFDLFKGIPIAQFAGASNGAILLDMKTNSILHAMQFSQQESSDIKALLKENFPNVETGTEHLDTIVLSPKLAEYMKWGLHKTRHQKSTKIFAFNPDMKGEDFYKAAKQIVPDNVSVVYSRTAYGDRHWIEILAGENNKGTVADKIAHLLEIDLQNCVGIGDEFNDLPLFEKTGISLAVSNAQDNIKEYADFVVQSNEEYAVAKTIDAIIEQNQ